MSATASPLTRRPRRPRKRGIVSALEQRSLLDVTRVYTDERDRVSRDARAQATKMVRGTVTISDEIVEEAYNTAWSQLYRKIEAGELIRDPRGWLVTTTSRRIVDATRREHEDRRDDAADPDDALERAVGGVSHADAIASQDAARGMLRELAERLTDREMQLVRLLILDGLTQAEAADLLGIKPKRVNKLVTETVLPALRKVGADMLIAEADVRVSAWCSSDEAHSRLTAMALDLLDPDGDRYQIISSHLANCPRCRAALATKKAAAGVIPPIFVPMGVGTSGETLERLQGMLDAVRDSNAPEIAAGTAAGGTLLVAGGGGGAVGGTFSGALLAKITAGAAAVAVGGTAGVATVDRSPEAVTKVRPPATAQMQVAATSSSLVARGEADVERARARARERAKARKRAAARKKAAETRKAADQKAGTSSQDFQPTVAAQQQDAARQQELSIERPAAAPAPSSGTAAGAPSNSGSSEFGIE